MKVLIKAEIVLIHFAIAFIGSYLSISVCEQLRLSCGNFESSKKVVFERLGMLFLMTLSLGLIAIWSMHFIGMYSITLVQPGSGDSLKIHFDIVETIFSLLIALLFCYLGFYFSHLDVLFGLSKKEIMEVFVKQKREKLSIKEIKKIGNVQILVYMAFTKIHYIVLGGVCMGCGVVVMHYLGISNNNRYLLLILIILHTMYILGMAAMKFQGKILWNAGAIFASIFLAIVASIVAFWIQFRLLSLFPSFESLKLVSAFAMAIAVCAVHNIGKFNCIISYCLL